MFTPPPSPDPFRTTREISPEPSVTVNGGFLAAPPNNIPGCLSKPPSSELEDVRRKIKSQTTRRIRWTILLVPAILILIAVPTRYFSQLQELAAWSSQLELSNSGLPTEWQAHKREPSPEPAPLPQQSSGGNSSSPTITTQTVPTIPASPPQLPTPFPQALDQSISSNFSTQGCQNFFLNMTASAAFRTCRPFSLLFQTSSDFVLAQTNLTELNNIMWGTCNTATDAAQCSQNMAWFAQDLQQECSEDVSDRNAVVLQTLKGLQTYDLYRTTACLPDQSTNAYCYVEAVHNTSPADLYYYFLPIGRQIPSTVQPSCSACMKSVMSLFAKSTADNSDLAQVYNGAVTIANKACGAGFVTTTSVNAGGRVYVGRGSIAGIAMMVLGVAGSLVLW